MIHNRQLLFAKMKSRAIVITPNNRLSAELISAFFRENPETIQDKPLCLPYSAFLQISYKKLCHNLPQKTHPLVLSSQQSRYLWRQTLAKATTNLVNEGLLQAVEEAWTRCHLWQVPLDHQSFAYNPQTLEFQRWALAFAEELDKLGAITEEQLASYLISQKNSYPYQDLIWACFDDYTPQQIALQTYFSEQCCQNEHYDLAEPESSTYCYAAKDNNDEYQQLSIWLEQRLAKGEKRIAVVVPQLQTEAAGLKRLLQQTLTAPFNISLGQALSDYPLAAHALSLLELDEERMSAAQAQLLLHSPYLAHSQSEMLARAQFREDSKTLQELYFPKASFIKELKTKVPKLAELLAGLQSYPEKASPKAWISHFKNRLTTLGFPGEYSLNSASYQCYQRFLTLFDEFKQIALLCTELSRSEAFAHFKNLAQASIFQAKTEQTNIQVLGLLEAAGSSFDSLWVTGLTDLCLPQKTRLSAFIPPALQRDKRMPYACHARELELARKALSRLSASSKEAIFSYPQLSEDKPNLPSPLLADLPPYLAETTQKADEGLPTQSTMVNYLESYEIPFAENEIAAGGTAILANQAKCPFRAFASHRLHAKAALQTSEGPDAIERGKVIHKVMEILWLGLKNQETLLNLDEKQLDNLIEEAIHQALKPLIEQRGYSFSALVQEVEFARLKKLVHSCLDWERQRPAFEVEALEEAFTINLAGSNFNLRVDRLDKLQDGSKWVIDYKSTLPTSMPWKEDRPKEPQLLLYALLDESINALLFAQLKSGQLQCRGFAAEKHEVDGLTSLKKEESWQSYRQQWQEQLSLLAEEFNRGSCQPKPASKTLCQRCDFQNLCRY